MSNPSTVSIQLIAAVANGIAQSQQPNAAGLLTLNGSLVSGGVATLDTARRVAVNSNGADAAVVFTIAGTNASGSSITDTVTGLNNSTGFTTLDFLTVTSVAVSQATAGNIIVGTNGVGSTPWVVDNFEATFWGLTVAGINESGAATWQIEHTYDDPNKVGPNLTPGPYQFSQSAGSHVPPVAWVNKTLNGMTANGETTYEGQPIFAHRLTVTTGTGKVTMQSIQAGIRS